MAASTLDWWREAGVDMLVDEAPRDWLASESVDARTVDTPRPRPAPAVQAAAEPVALPATLDAFAAWRIGPDAPDAGWNAVRIGAAGSASSGVMVLIDAPDREDEANGMLLSGAAGILFDRMLAAIGRDRGSVYLASLAVARPGAGRVPPEALAELGRIARHHIMLTAPKRLLMIGNAVSRAILGADIAALRGNLHDVNHAKGTVGAVASFHPRFLLERPAMKAEAWRDLQLLIGGLDA